MRLVLAFTRVFQLFVRRTLGVLVGAVSRLVTGVGWLLMLLPDVWLVSGQERSSQLPLTALCAVSNWSRNRNYVLDLIFADGYDARRLGRYWLWNLAKAVPATTDCPVILAELRQSHISRTPWTDWFYVPAWVWGEVQLPRDTEATRKVSGDLRRIRRRGLAYEVTRDPRHFEDFYHNMYVPYVKVAFGNCAVVQSYRSARRTFRRGELLLIKQGEKAIAGQLIVHGADGDVLQNVGFRDGDRTYVQEGAGCALYHFGLQHMQDKGFKVAGVGWTRAFLRDGVLRFKKKWSQRIVASSMRGFALRVSPRSPAARAFLVNNPFVWKREEQYYGAVFTDDEQLPSEDDLRLIDRDYFHPGMSRLFVYCLRSVHAPPQGRVPEECGQRMELRGAADVPGGMTAYAALRSQ